MSDDIHEVYAVCYGTHARKRSENYIFGDPQDTEMAYATGRCMCHQMLRIPFSENDVLAMVRKVFAYRVEFHDGAEELAPGITVHKIGGHSKDLQCVT